MSELATEPGKNERSGPTPDAGDATANRVVHRGGAVPRWFRLVAIAEAISWLLLIVATVIKYAADAPLGVHILGPIHGVLFVAYVLLALVVRSKLAWNVRTTAIVLLDSIIPGGGFLVARRADLQT